MPVPEHPKIYHIVHIDKLASIVREGQLFPDSVMSLRQEAAVIGMGSIKQRRLTLPVASHSGTYVGQYVPFYFCPRSIMLYLIHCANHPELAYRGGQQPIVHLEADLYGVIEWLEAHNRRWAFSLSNAGANYTQFRTGRDKLDEINWESVSAHDFRTASIKEGKQSEFLVHDGFPWHLIGRIGYLNNSISSTSSVLDKITFAIQGTAHKPVVQKCNEWYY